MARAVDGRSARRVSARASQSLRSRPGTWRNHAIEWWLPTEDLPDARQSSRNGSELVMIIRITNAAPFDHLLIAVQAFLLAKSTARPRRKTVSFPDEMPSRLGLSGHL